MKLQEILPYMVCVNLAGREDRRREVWAAFRTAGLTVDRQPGIPASRVGDPHGYVSASRYACSLAKRLAIRRARLAGTPAMLLFEDDVVLAGDLHQRLAEIELPDDWGIFFLGCKHLTRPTPVSPGLVRVTRAADHHAMAIRADYFQSAIRGLAGTGKKSRRTIRYSDVKMADIQADVPTYAAFPNLAWQSLSHSDNARATQSHYDAAGNQLTDRDAVAGLHEDLARMTSAEPVPPGDLQVARRGGSSARPRSALAEMIRTLPGYDFIGATAPSHPLEKRFPVRFYINLGRREDRRADAEYRFLVQGLPVERLPAADGKRVRNARGHGPANVYACRLSHRLAIRHARQRKAPAVLIFEDDVVLHPEFRRLAEALAPPADWDILLFGCTHVETPEVVAPGWVEVGHFWSLHAYAVRETAYRRVLSALGSAGQPGREEGADVILSRLAPETRIYSLYPNLAWQDEGFSDLKHVQRKPFTDDGHQNRLLHVLTRTNLEMRERIAADFGEEALIARRHSLLRPGDVHAPEPEPRWRLGEAIGSAVYLNLEDRSDRRSAFESQTAVLPFPVTRFGAVAASRKPRGSDLKAGAYGCALSHCLALRQAAALGHPSLLIFEDDAVLHPKMVPWIESVDLPEDWGILYLGCQHIAPPIPVSPGLVRVTSAYSTHAYAVRSGYYRQVMEAIREGCRQGQPCDVTLSHLHRQIPTYALYPNLVWQSDGPSDVKGAASSSYGADGVQRWHREILSEADQIMTTLVKADPGRLAVC